MQWGQAGNSVVVTVTGVAPPRPVLLPPLLSGTNLILTWTAVSNTTYLLEYNPDLGPSNWIALPGDIISSNNLASKLDPLSLSNRFYRVRVLP